MSAYAHFKRACGILGLWVGARDAEVQVADASGNLFQAGTQLTPTAAQINTLTGTDRAVKVKRVALAAVDTGGGVFAWANPESSAIIVERVCIDATTKSTSACTVDIGTTATSAATSIDNLLDGLDVGTAAGLFNNIDEHGTNGKSRQKLASGKWVTASVASGASAGLVGYAYIHYVVI